MIAFHRYLGVPTLYADALGGLQWSAAGDAVEDGDGRTDFVAAEVLAFLEGFDGERPLISFGYVLHLLCLLHGIGRRTSRAPLEALSRAYRRAGMPARRGGALCGRLCTELDTAPDAPRVAEVIA